MLVLLLFSHDFLSEVITFIVRCCVSNFPLWEVLPFCVKREDNFSQPNVVIYCTYYMYIFLSFKDDLFFWKKINNIKDYSIDFLSKLWIYIAYCMQETLIETKNIKLFYKSW